MLPTDQTGPEPARSPLTVRRAAALRIALWGGIGAGIGRIIWEATFEKEGPVHWGLRDWIGLTLAIATVIFWEWWIEPSLESRVHGKHDSAEADHSRAKKHAVRRALQAIIFVFIVEMMFELVHGPLRQNPFGFLRSVLLIAITAGGITYSWVRSSSRSLLPAIGYGFLAGLVISYVLTVAEACFWPGDFGINRQQLPVVLNAWRFHFQLGLNALEWGTYGAAGALAINRKWGRCPSSGVLATTLIVDPAWWLVLWVVIGQAFIQKVAFAAFLVGTFRTIFWGLALYICPGADEVLDPPMKGRSRSGPAVSWGLYALAVLLCAIVIAVKIVADQQKH